MDSSHLVIDPVLESFYLVDAMMLKILPFMDMIESYRAVFSEVNQFQALTTKALETADFLLVEPDKSQFSNAYDEMTLAIDKGYQLFDKANLSLRAIVQDRIEFDKSKRNTMLVFVFTVSAAGILFTYLVGRSITVAVSNRISEERRNSIVNSRIKQALESASSVVLVVNRSGKITYCNNAGLRYFKQHQDEFSTDLGHAAASLETVRRWNATSEVDICLLLSALFRMSINRQ